MLTAVYSLGRVHGAEIWLAGWLICAAAFLLIGFLRKENRSVRGVIRHLSGLLAAGALVDLVWFRFYYPDGQYINHGIAGTYLLLLWPALLAVTGFVLNFRRSSD